MIATTSEGADSAVALDRRFDESNKPRIVLWSWCPNCKRGSWFRSIKRDERRNKLPVPFTDNGVEGTFTRCLVKVKGNCMVCLAYSEFHTDEEELAASRYSPKSGDLCICGYPAFHLDPPANLRRTLNIQPVPCRPSRNGHGSP